MAQAGDQHLLQLGLVASGAITVSSGMARMYGFDVVLTLVRWPIAPTMPARSARR